MRLSVAKGFVKTMTRDSEAITPERLCIAALLQIYGVPDPIALYVKHKYRADHFLRELLAGELLPVKNALQDEMRLLTSSAPRLNLYLTTYRAPDLIVSLSLNPDGLYQLAHLRIRTFQGLPPRDGLCIYWADTAPPPDHAVSMPPLFERVIRGGRASNRLFSEVRRDYELRRQLSTLKDLEDLIAVAPTKTLSIWHHLTPGRATFEVSTDTTPYTFTPLSMRPNIRPGSKFRVHILGDIPPDQLRDAIGKQPRYFAPRVKGQHHADLPIRHRILLRKLLLLLPTPVVGVFRDGNRVDLYCLHFDGHDVDPALLQTIALRLDAVPWLMLPDSNHFATPNAQLLYFIKTALLEPASDMAYNREHRLSVLKELLKEFTGGTPLPDFFAECGSPMSPSEAEHVLSL